MSLYSSLSLKACGQWSIKSYIEWCWMCGANATFSVSLAGILNPASIGEATKIKPSIFWAWFAAYQRAYAQPMLCPNKNSLWLGWLLRTCSTTSLISSKCRSKPCVSPLGKSGSLEFPKPLRSKPYTSVELLANSGPMNLNAPEWTSIPCMKTTILSDVPTAGQCL